MSEVEDLKRELETQKENLKKLQVELVQANADAWADGELTVGERFELEQLSTIVEMADAICNDLMRQIREKSPGLAPHEASHAVQQEADSIIADIEEAAREAQEAVEEAARESDDAVEEAAEEAAEAIDEASKEASDAVEEAAEDAADAVEEAAKEAEDAVDEAAQEAEDAIDEAKQAASTDGEASGDAFTPPKEANEPTLRKGDESEDGWVEYLQQLLNKHLGKGTVTVNGKFDQATFKAVKEFQGKAGCKVDGIVGNQTWSALREDKVLAEIGTDGRAPGEFVEQGAEARWAMESGHTFAYTESKDTFMMVAVSVGTEPIKGYPVDILINGERRKTVIGPQFNGEDDPNHAVILEEIVARHGNGPFKIEAYLPQELGGDKWEGELEEQSGGGGEDDETFDLVATFLSEASKRPPESTVLVELAGGPKGFKAPPSQKLGKDGLFTATVPNGTYVLVVKIGENTENFVVQIDGKNFKKTYHLVEPSDGVKRVVLAATVTDAKSGEPIEGLAVGVDKGPDGFVGAFDETGKNGQIEMLVPVDAVYQVTVITGDSKEHSKDVKVGSSDVDVPFKIDQAGGGGEDPVKMVTMTVKVVDGANDPVDSAVATVVSNNSEVFFDEGATLGSDGIFELDVPANNEYTVSAEFKGATDKKTVKVGDGPIKVGLDLEQGAGDDPNSSLKMTVEDYTELKRQMTDAEPHYEGEYNKGVETIDALTDQSNSSRYRKALDSAFESMKSGMKSWHPLADQIIEIQKKFDETVKSNPGKAKEDLKRAKELDSDAQEKAQAVVAAIGEMAEAQQSAEKELSGTQWDLKDYGAEVRAVEDSFKAIKKQHIAVLEKAHKIEDEEIKTIRTSIAEKSIDRFQEKFNEWTPIGKRLEEHQTNFESNIKDKPLEAVDHLNSARDLVADEEKLQGNMKTAQEMMDDIEKQIDQDLKQGGADTVTLTVNVVDEAGELIADSIAVITGGPDDFIRGGMKAVKDGIFAGDVPVNDSYDVFAEGGGATNTETIKVAEKDLDTTIKLKTGGADTEEGHVLKVIVTSTEELPTGPEIWAAEVTVKSASKGVTLGPIETNQDGVAEFKDVTDGDYVVTAVVGKEKNEGKVTIAGKDASLPLSVKFIPPPNSLKPVLGVFVMTQGLEEKIVGAAVTLEAGKGGPAGFTKKEKKTGSDGSAQFSHLEAGTYKVSATTPDAVKPASREVDFDGDFGHVVLKVDTPLPEDGARLKVVVAGDRSLERIQGAAVHLTGGPKGFKQLPASTDKHGEVEFGALPDGAYNIVVKSEDPKDEKSRNITIEGEDVLEEFRLEEAPNVKGAIMTVEVLQDTEEENVVIPGVTIKVVTRPGGKSLGKLTTGSDGRVVIPGIEEGDYTVTAEWQGETQKRDIEVIETIDEPVDFFMKVGPV